MILEITNGYNKQLDQLNEINIYFKLSKIGKETLYKIIDYIKKYYALLLKYYKVHNGDTVGDEKLLLKDLKVVINNLQRILSSEDTRKILDRMKKELKIR